MANTYNPDLLQQAIDFHQSNRLNEAREIYQSILAEDPTHSLTLRLLGTLMFQSGEYEPAVESLEQSLKGNPNDAETWNILGLLFQTIGKPDAALSFYNNALALEPSNVSILTNFGILLSSIGKMDEAYDALSKAYAVEPESIESLYNLALCLQQMEKLEESEKYYALLLSKQPFHVTAHINVGVIYRKLKKDNRAEHEFLQALALDPDSIDAAYNIASLWTGQKREVEAERLLKDIIKKKPDYFEAWNDLGELFFQRLQFDEALRYFSKAIEISPKRWEGNFNLGLVYQELGQFLKAKESLETALQFAPENHLIHFAIAEVLFALGDYSNGWNAYENRLKFELFNDKKYDIPRWHGESLREKTIFIFEEQGSGDTFQFLRYLAPLKNSGARIVFHGKPQHERLLRSHPYIDEYVLDDTVAKQNKYDFYSPLLSLPGVLGQGHYTLAETVPYLQAPEESKAAWESVFSADKNYKIGLFWCGNTFSSINKKRHCSLQDFSPLLDLPGTTFYSLQVGEPAAELLQPENAGKIIDLGTKIKDFADTASIISHLDVVITVDTSIAHLAGALGKNTLLLLAKTPDWRWIQESPVSDWYPSIQLFRQEEQGNWLPVISTVKEVLSREISSKFQTAHGPLVFALSSGENFGWGVCSKYLTQETEKKREVISYAPGETGTIPDNCTVFHALRGADLKTLRDIRGRTNIGYTFFENELNENSVREGRKLDYIFGGSTWNKIKLEEKGLKPSGVLIQGVDPEIFYPRGDHQKESLFTIFSGGKFELRKGQDLVIKAVSIMQKKYPDVILVNAWFNIWQQTMLLMSSSKHIKFNPHGANWHDFVSSICIDNGLDIGRVLTLPLMKNELLPDIYSKTDIGLFPNRCEGGTNLVLMEYMACGKPVIAAFNSGHTDILTDVNSLPLREQKQYLMHENGELVADWSESSIDEILAKLEWAYHHRDEIKKTGANAGKYMQNFTWERTADSLLSDLQELGYI